jgi:uncharacterized phage protein (TIGR01671 family)
MREIKFRAKSIHNGEWVYGALYEFEDSCWILPQKPNKIGSTGFSCIGKGLEIFGAIRVDPKTVGQYIGLEDKNKQEIYEGDIVKNDNGNKFLIAYIDDICGFFQVLIEKDSIYGEFKNGTCRNLKPYMTDMRFNLKEVIGNIHENPELLKK